MSREGIIIKGIGSFYYVLEPNEVVTECRLRGNFRNKKIVPAVGDRVEFTDEGNDGAVIVKVHERLSYLTRPVVANATQAIVVCAIKEPELSFLLLDKMLIHNSYCGLKSIVCFNKTDLASEEEISHIMETYKDCGAKLIFISAEQDESVSVVKELLSAHITVLSGVSGAGKSTLLNRLLDRKMMETGEVSHKIKRGRHTTRHSEILTVDKNSFIMDTPGFSTLTIDNIPCEKICEYYDDFYEFSDCAFSSCVHLKEPKCRVKEALDEGKISKLRYENYITIYEEAKKSYKKY